jgi:hypothetical protein
MLRIARLLRQETLDDCALAIGSVKSHLSELERFDGQRVSKNLQGRLASHFGASWPVLVSKIDGKALAASLLASAAKQVKPHKDTKNAK